jgi:hypothetical protein
LRHSRRRITALTTVGIMLAALAVVLILLGRGRLGQDFNVPRADLARPLGTPPRQLQSCLLYYGAPQRPRLETEVRFLTAAPSAEARIEQLIRALAEGSVKGLVSTLPHGVIIRSVFLDEQGTAYVDFAGTIREEMIRDPDWADSDHMEWLCVASLVRTLVENIPAVSQVRLQIEGSSKGVLARIMPLDLAYSPQMLPNPMQPEPPAGTGETSLGEDCESGYGLAHRAVPQMARRHEVIRGIGEDASPR